MNLTRNELQVWLARETLADDAATAADFLVLLSDEERARHERFAADTPRRLHLVARGLVRTVLSRYAPEVAPAAWRFAHSDIGRPSLAPPFDATGLHFNLAHTRGLVVLAVGRIPRIGIDVEACDKRVRLDIARRYFSERESAALFALPPEEQPARFLRLWTLKESYLKAIGTGVAGGLGKMTFTLDEPGGIRFERADDPAAPRWKFREYRPRGFLVALACLDEGVSLVTEPELREFSR